MKSYVAMLRTDADDKLFTNDALADAGITVDIRYLDTMKELNRLLKTEGPPSLILLNDNEAVHKGYKRLGKIKKQKSLGHVPVIVLGEMSNPDYIRKCYQAGANSFIVKPASIAETNRKIKTFFTYWLEVAAL